nr:unnamed protein product [Digitaria exilis]
MARTSRAQRIQIAAVSRLLPPAVAAPSLMMYFSSKFSYYFLSMLSTL